MTQQNICDSVDTMNALLQAMRSPFQSCPLFSCRCDKSKNEWKNGSVNTIRYKEQKKELEFTKNGVIILEKNLDETHRKLDLILKNQTETKNEIVKIKMNMPLQVAEPANEQTKQQITK